VAWESLLGVVWEMLFSEDAVTSVVEEEISLVVEPLVRQDGVFSLVLDVELFPAQSAGTSKDEVEERTSHVVGGYSLVEVRTTSLDEVCSRGEEDWYEVGVYSKVQYVATLADVDEVIFLGEGEVTSLGVGRTTSLLEVKAT